MKTLKLFTMAFLATSVSFAKNSVLIDVQPALKQIQNLEASGQTREAVYLAAQASQQVAESIKSDQVVRSIESKLNEIRDEVITQRVNQGASFNFLGLISGKGSRHFDVAKIITTNPKEVAGFESKVAQDFLGLQNELKNYLIANELGLIYQKALAAKALQLALTLTSEDRAEVYELITKTWQQSQSLTFIGLQSISKCITTNYANRSSGMGLSLGGLFLSLSLSEEKNEYARTERTCTLTGNTTEVSEELLMSARLQLVEQAGEKYNKTLGLLTFAEKEPKFYPTWGNPYYK